MEIIVVLVIIAILAAIAIPTMLGFVNEARQSEYIAEGRTAYVAAQTIATREFALDPASTTIEATIKTDYKQITGTATKVKSIEKATVDANGKVTDFECTVTKNSDGSGQEYIVKINTTNNTATCEKKTA